MVSSDDIKNNIKYHRNIFSRYLITYSISFDHWIGDPLVIVRHDRRPLPNESHQPGVSIYWLIHLCNTWESDSPGSSARCMRRPLTDGSPNQWSKKILCVIIQHHHCNIFDDDATVSSSHHCSVGSSLLLLSRVEYAESKYPLFSNGSLFPA